MNPGDKIQNFLWFDGQAEAAVAFYRETFSDCQVGAIHRYGPNMGYPEGHAMTVSFRLFGQSFVALNAGPMYTFTPAVSFLITCEDQAEVDRYWNALAEGGKPMACGWISDRFGVTWQITPKQLLAWMSDEDPVRVQRVTASMMTMVKLEIEPLRRAYEGPAAEI